MKKFDQWWLPAHEQHLQGWMSKVNHREDGRLTYQYGKYKAALKYTSHRELAIDVGAHVGLWSYFMARDFKTVHCFEPMPAHIECWKMNMQGKDNAHLHEMALGEGTGNVAIETRTPDSSGDTGVIPGKAGLVPMQPLDFFAFESVGFIKIDTEGFEEFILRGARETLLACKPVVLVEQKGDMSKKYGLETISAVRFLESLGAVQREVISGDYILSWD